MVAYDGERLRDFKDYTIKQRQKSNAARLGVSIRPSENKNKKLDVIKDGEVIASIGGRYYDGVWYKDYASLLEDPTDRYGNELNPKQRRDMYLKRHAHEAKYTKGTKANRRKGMKRFRSPSYWSDVILWS
tara:strand:- start:327 stop:716 length:390 start_codon:yes stop_codon:yes gene_type:complete